MIDADNMSIAELRQLAEANGSVAQFADAFKKLEELQKSNAELEKKNAEMRESIEKSREYRHEQDAIRALQEDVAQIKAHTINPALTKEDIMAVKDTHKRLELIREHMELFRDNQPKQNAEQKAVQNAQAVQNERIMKKYGVTADMTPAEICKLMPSGSARQYAIRKSLERAE